MRYDATRLFAGIVVAASAQMVSADLAAALNNTSAPTWTGFYLGVSVGGKQADSQWTNTYLNVTIPVKTDASSPADFRSANLRIGGYLGYNWQFEPQWVAGFELDIAHSSKTF